MRIDAPETAKGKGKPGQPFSQRAKKYLAKMVLNKVVNVKGYGLEPYNRVLGVITSEGRTVNLEMVKAGLAEGYRRKAPYRFNVFKNVRVVKQLIDDTNRIFIIGGMLILSRTPILRQELAF